MFNIDDYDIRQQQEHGLVSSEALLRFQGL
jgi:hypothetical protein